jgi:hypothetical protein
MSTQLNIHPVSYNRLHFKASPAMKDNGNCVSLFFWSLERRAQYDFDTVQTEVTAFRMNDTDAEILSTIGLLRDEYREKLLPAIRDALADQESDDEIQSEEPQSA